MLKKRFLHDRDILSILKFRQLQLKRLMEFTKSMVF